MNSIQKLVRSLPFAPPDSGYHIQGDEAGPLGRMQGEAIVHKNAYVSLLLWHFKYILAKVVYAKVNRTAENVPLVVLGTRQACNVLNFRALSNLAPALPTSRALFVGRY